MAFRTPTRSDRVLALVLLAVFLGVLGWIFYDAYAGRRDDEAAAAVSDSERSAATQSPTPTPTATPEPSPTTEPEPTAEPTEEEIPKGPPPSPEPTSGDDLADVRALAELGGPAEIFGDAEQAKQITNPLHARWWESFQPASVTNPAWEWANKDELWDDITAEVWGDAVERYGTRVHGRVGTVWPGADVSGNALWGWSSHEASGGYGHVGLARVALTSEDPDQQRPDLAVYWMQIRVTPTDDPTVFVGDLHRVFDPFEMPGTLAWSDDEGGQVTEFLRNSPEPPSGSFDPIQSESGP